MIRKIAIFSCALLAMNTICQCADVILNEYNAVSGSKQLDEGQGKDSVFGTIDGNGGNWFELLVIEDNVDMRGWSLIWAEDEVVEGGNETATGTITLSDDDIWSDLRTGSIITFIESDNADGQGDFNTGTDISYDPFNGDWWINIATQSEQAKGEDALVTTTTNDGDPGDFSVGNDDWTLSIMNSANELVFGPAGEGNTEWAGGNVNSEEAGSLEGPGVSALIPEVTVEMWRAVTPTSEFYDDTGSTSFGAGNVDYDDVDNVFSDIQSLDVLRNQILGPDLKSGDFNEDGALDENDINALTTAVGDPNADARFDVDSSGAVDAEDRRLWIESIRKTYFGDSNLDGEFSSSDFVFVFQANEYEDGIPGNSKWETGDWNGDGDFTTSDFVIAFEEGGYEQGPRIAQAVPEPTAIWLVFLGIMGAWRFHLKEAAISNSFQI